MNLKKNWYSDNPTNSFYRAEVIRFFQHCEKSLSFTIQGIFMDEVTGKPGNYFSFIIF